MPYLPAHDEERDPEVLGRFVAEHPLAQLVTHDGTAPDVDLVPLVLDERGGGRQLVGHVARANPLWQGRQRGPVLAVFGPVQHYVSPTWYPSKQEHHRVVPTWDYLVVHVRGPLVVHDDQRWIRGVLARLTNHMELGREDRWRMGQAPNDYLDEMARQVVGISIPVESMVGKFKRSAHRTEADRLGAADGMELDPHQPPSPELVRAMRGVPGGAAG